MKRNNYRVVVPAYKEETRTEGRMDVGVGAEEARRKSWNPDQCGLGGVRLLGKELDYGYRK